MEQSTPAIRIKCERHFALGRQTPLPTTPQIPGAFAPAVAPPAPAKPLCSVGPPGFAPRSEAPASTGNCSPDCRDVAEGSDNPYAHRFPCLRSDFEPIKIQLRPLKEAPQRKSKQNRCGYSASVRHTRHSDSTDFVRDNSVNTRAVSQQPPPLLPNPLPERMDKNTPDEDGF